MTRVSIIIIISNQQTKGVKIMAKVIREDLGPHLCSILGCDSVAAKRYSRYGDVSHRDVWLCDDCAKQIGKLAAG